jgi:hypothetical protein
MLCECCLTNRLCIYACALVYPTLSTLSSSEPAPPLCTSELQACLALVKTRASLPYASLPYACMAGTACCSVVVCVLLQSTAVNRPVQVGRITSMSIRSEWLSHLPASTELSLASARVRPAVWPVECVHLGLHAELSPEAGVGHACSRARVQRATPAREARTRPR